MLIESQKKTSGTVYYRHRPTRIDKKVALPISINEDDKNSWNSKICRWCGYVKNPNSKIKQYSNNVTNWDF